MKTSICFFKNGQFNTGGTVMLVLEGILINVFETPKGVTKDGKEYGGESKIQVMYENTLANGEKRTEMETLTVTDTSTYLNKKTRLCAFLWL